MDMRDKIALKMMPALYTEMWQSVRLSGYLPPSDEFWAEALAIDAYRIADAMIKVRTETLQKTPDKFISDEMLGITPEPEYSEYYYELCKFGSGVDRFDVD